MSKFWFMLFPAKEYKIVVVGLDNAGKTTTLYKLHLGEVVNTNPTIGSNVEEVVYKNIRFEVRSLFYYSSDKPKLELDFRISKFQRRNNWSLEEFYREKKCYRTIVV